jgi:hypothetical protein
MYAALNDLQMKVGDVLNAYITAPIREKVWTVLGPEFGQDAGKSTIIVRFIRTQKCWCSVSCSSRFLYAFYGTQIL